ncbi:MAG: sigma-70 family RNA polymerase sigma factor [Muribaculaceae bacterium]|nr:sigma-70 family RNA polymerase sigma factor [Roseburia sp.]MCM1430576.1 sigma-70 family RNA polymerase sigma factor [Muribaculaceae bacterium]MCM1492683.1 sigma-70 family RNA polymerase sigma factor [Muribaculaceae bacterium]
MSEKGDKIQLGELTDEALVERIRRGHGEVTDYLLEKYKPLVRKKTNAMYLIGGETEDLIQEGMIGLFKAIRDYRQDRDSSFYHFAELCVNRQLYSALEASNRKKHFPLNSYVPLSGTEDDGEDGAFLGQTKSPEQQIIEQELWSDFKKRLTGNLSKMENKVLILYLEGYNYIQIAELLQKSPKSVDNALQRIRQKIKRMKYE